MTDAANDAEGRRRLRGDEAEIQTILDSFPQYVLMVDSEHTVIMANRSLFDTFGMKPEDIVGEYCPKAIHGLDSAYPGCPVEEAHQLGASVERELFDEATDRWMRSAAYVTDLATLDNKPVYLHVVQDITEQKKADEALSALRTSLEDTVALRTHELETANRELQTEIAERRRAEEKIRQLAYYDVLTGLPNRASFSDLLGKHIESAQAEGRRIGIALLDLDGFKTVNDTTGHDAGDALLRLVGKRLAEATRSNDVAARMGGDEFLFIFTKIDALEDMVGITQRLLDVFDQPFMVGGRRFEVAASIGTAVYPDDGLDEVALMKGADLAMYRAKNEGGARFCRFGDHSPEEAE
jgi:diguanylate cyclase (GGDEF)-like protein/PAS domain S-box-containing protein